MDSLDRNGWVLTAYCGCKSCCGKEETPIAPPEDCIAADSTKLTNDDAEKVCAAPKNGA
jgi:hypothetical protein